MFGVHPGDLTVQENGVRLLAGSNGVKSAFQISRPEVRASSYLVSNELDGGPILITSPPVPVDYSLHTDEEARFRHYLKLVNEQSRLVGARTALELALGHFQRDEKGTYYYKGQPAPLGIKLENWQEYPPDYQLRREYLLHPRSIAGAGRLQQAGNRTGHCQQYHLLWLPRQPLRRQCPRGRCALCEGRPHHRRDPG